MLLGVGSQAQVAGGGGELPVEVPVGVVFRAVKVEEVFQQLGGADQFGVELFGEMFPRVFDPADEDAALPGTNSHRN